MRTDDRLVGALRRGDERAFEAIYDRYHRALLGFCQQMLGSREEAEDALQHVFVAAYRHLREGRGRVQLKPWLYTVARNRCLSMLRMRRDELALDHVPEPQAAGATAADAECREDLGEVLRDLTRLPDDQRTALVLAELGDLTHTEIAATLDVRKDKVKALIFQARSALAARRQARTADCQDIQEQLATLRGSALRRAPIRQHIAVCPSCAAFEREVAHQREALALLLPAIPAAALKHSVLSAAMSSAGTGAGAAGAAGAGAAASGVGAGVAGAGASGLAAKTLAVAALAIGAGGGGVVAVHELDSPRPLTRPAATAPARTQAPAAAPTAADPSAASQAAIHRRNESAHPSKDDAARGRSANAPGRAKARKAKRNRSQKAERVNRGRLRAAARRQATRPAPATSRRPSADKAPPAKGRPTTPAPVRANPGKDSAPGQTKSPAAGRKPGGGPPPKS